MLSVRIDNGEIYSNTASLSAGIENHSGNATVPVVILNSHLHHNHAGFTAGAIGNYGTLVISKHHARCELGQHHGDELANTRGGGLYNYEGGRST